MRSYTILGTGALGGYYGGLLAKAGFPTRFVLRSDLDHVRKHGLKVDSVDGSFHLPSVEAFGPDDPVPPSDVVVVCTKTTGNANLAEQLTRLVGPNSHVLVLQNGLMPEAAAVAAVGPERVMGGLCFLCSNKVGPGHIHHLDYGPIDLGVHQPAVGDADTQAARQSLAQAVAADFNQAGIHTRAVDDLREARWRKLVWNVPYNGLSVVLEQDTSQIMGDPDTVQLVETIMREVEQTAWETEGLKLPEGFVESRLDHTRKMRPYKTSMMLDHEQGRALEHEAIVGDVCRAAAKVGFAVPHTQRLYEQLCEKDPTAN